MTTIGCISWLAIGFFFGWFACELWHIWRAISDEMQYPDLPKKDYIVSPDDEFLAEMVRIKLNKSIAGGDK